VIHRAVSGSFERFIAILIEHFAGAFPTWARAGAGARAADLGRIGVSSAHAPECDADGLTGGVDGLIFWPTLQEK
jgi:hypothetical protein